MYVDSTQRLTLNVYEDGLEVGVNGKLEQVPGVTPPSERFKIQLRGWQPSNRWRVTDLVVR